MARATSSLPVPLSPSTSTAESVGATRSTTRITSCIRGLLVRLPEKAAALATADAVAVVLLSSQLTHRRVAQAALVVGDQHADRPGHCNECRELGSHRGWPVIDCRGSVDCRALFHGDDHTEHAALGSAALHLDPAAVIGDDALRDGEAEARALPGRLGGEEWVEDPADNFL